MMETFLASVYLCDKTVNTEEVVSISKTVKLSHCLFISYRNIRLGSGYLLYVVLIIFRQKQNEFESYFYGSLWWTCGNSLYRSYIRIGRLVSPPRFILNTFAIINIVKSSSRCMNISRFHTFSEEMGQISVPCSTIASVLDNRRLRASCTEPMASFPGNGLIKCSLNAKAPSRRKRMGCDVFTETGYQVVNL